MPKGNEATRFKPGHRLSVGNRGAHRPDFCTQELISQLNEVDKTTNKEKKHLLVEALIRLALGYTYTKEVVLKNGKDEETIGEIEVIVPPDRAAISDCFDRVEGKARQSLIVAGDPDNPLKIIHEDAEAFTRSIIEASVGTGTPGDPYRDEPGGESEPAVALAVQRKAGATTPKR